MFWLLFIGCLACYFSMIFFLRKAYHENINNLSGYDFSATNWKVMLSLMLGMNLPNFLNYSEEGIQKWFSISVPIVFLATFLIILYYNRKKVIINENTKSEESTGVESH